MIYSASITTWPKCWRLEQRLRKNANSSLSGKGKLPEEGNFQHSLVATLHLSMIDEWPLIILFLGNTTSIAMILGGMMVLGAKKTLKDKGGKPYKGATKKVKASKPKAVRSKPKTNNKKSLKAVTRRIQVKSQGTSKKNVFHRKALVKKSAANKTTSKKSIKKSKSVKTGKAIKKSAKRQKEKSTRTLAKKTIGKSSKKFSAKPKHKVISRNSGSNKLKKKPLRKPAVQVTPKLKDKKKAKSEKFNELEKTRSTISPVKQKRHSTKELKTIATNKVVSGITDQPFEDMEDELVEGFPADLDDELSEDLPDDFGDDDLQGLTDELDDDLTEDLSEELGTEKYFRDNDNDLDDDNNNDLPRGW